MNNITDFLPELEPEFWQGVPQAEIPKHAYDTPTGHPDVTYRAGPAKIKIRFREVNYLESIRAIQEIVLLYGKAEYNLESFPGTGMIDCLDIMFISRFIPISEQVKPEKYQLVAVLVANVYSKFVKKEK